MDREFPLRKRIDMKRLDAAIKMELNGGGVVTLKNHKTGEVVYFEKGATYEVLKPWYAKGFNYYWYNYKPYIPYGGETPSRITKLCALKAHTRGALHISRKRVPNYSEGGCKTVACTYEQQAEFIKDVLEEFLLPEVVTPAAE